MFAKSSNFQLLEDQQPYQLNGKNGFYVLFYRTFYNNCPHWVDRVICE